MMNNNSKVYGVYLILKKALPIWFVFLLFLLSKGLNYTEAILLDSFSALTAIAFEVPSGILADKISRKRLILIGETAIVLNYVFLLFSNAYWCFVCGALISGIGQACVSGTGEALIYDEINDGIVYKKYMGKINKYSYIVVAIVTFSSSWLFEIYANLPLMISIALELIGILIMLFFYKENHLNKPKNEKGIRGEIANQFGILRKYANSRNIICITGLSLVMLEIISNLNYTTQAYLPSIGLEVRYLGVILLVFNIISAAGAKATEKMPLNGRVWLLFYVAVLALASVPSFPVVLIALCLSRFINGFIWTLISTETNRQIESKERATALSFINLVTELLPMVLDPIIAVSYDKYGFPVTYRILAAVLLAIVIFSTVFIAKNRHTGT